MDIEVCKQCVYYVHNLLTEENMCGYEYIQGDSNGYFIKCESIQPDCTIKICSRFRKKREPLRYGHYEKILGDGKMKNDNFKTYLRSEDERKDKILSYVEISCKNYDTFKQIVEAVMPILEKEDIKECD